MKKPTYYLQDYICMPVVSVSSFASTSCSPAGDASVQVMRAPGYARLRDVDGFAHARSLDDPLWLASLLGPHHHEFMVLMTGPCEYY